MQTGKDHFGRLPCKHFEAALRVPNATHCEKPHQKVKPVHEQSSKVASAGNRLLFHVRSRAATNSNRFQRLNSAE